MLPSCTYNRLFVAMKSSSRHIQLIHLKKSLTSKLIHRFLRIFLLVNFPVQSSIPLGINQQLNHTEAWLVLLHFEAKELGYSCCIPLLNPKWRPYIILPNVSLCHMLSCLTWKSFDHQLPLSFKNIFSTQQWFSVCILQC